MSQIKIIAVIPARMNSTRFPGKPLVSVKGLPMIEHVRRRVLMCDKLDDVIVATCDKSIYDLIRSYGGNVMMTSRRHKMASDRVSEVVKKYDCTHVINVQGDEILVNPKELEMLIDEIKKNPLNDFWNAIAPIKNHNDLKNKDIVKGVTSLSGNIIYCSRILEKKDINRYKNSLNVILGILAYSKNGILKFNQFKRTNIESVESIDQMRIIENDKILKSCRFKFAYPGINTKAEYVKVIKILSSDNLQKGILKAIKYEK